MSWISGTYFAPLHRAASATIRGIDGGVVTTSTRSFFLKLASALKNVDSPSVRALLTEYFQLRAESFPPAMGDYTVTLPDPAYFTRPDGVFIVVEDADLAGDAADVGCGGVRRIPSPIAIPVAAWRLWQAKRAYERGGDG